MSTSTNDPCSSIFGTNVCCRINEIPGSCSPYDDHAFDSVYGIFAMLEPLSWARESTPFRRPRSFPMPQELMQPSENDLRYCLILRAQCRRGI